MSHRLQFDPRSPSVPGYNEEMDSKNNKAPLFFDELVFESEEENNVSVCSGEIQDNSTPLKFNEIMYRGELQKYIFKN